MMPRHNAAPHQTLSLYTGVDLCYNYQIKLDDQEAEL